MKTRRLLVLGLVGAIAVGLVVALISARPMASAAPVDDASNVPPLRVLVVTPQPTVGYAGGIQELLSQCGTRVEVASWERATAQFAENFDVLVVTGLVGLGQRLDKRDVCLDYRPPIVAYGPYGCKYLGLMHLKNGYPYT